MQEQNSQTGMTRRDVLEAAAACVCKSRDKNYGKPEDSFRVIAGLWTEYLKGRPPDVDAIRPHDVAAMMGLLKISRIATGRSKADNWIDLAGYAACGGEMDEGW